MKRTLLAAALTLTTLPAFAQDDTQDIDELARQYVEMPQVQTTITQMFSPEAMAAQVASTLPPGVTLSDDQRSRIGDLLATEMNALRPRLEELMVSGSAETFSAPELEALIDFYGSEHGAAVMSKMQPFFSSVTQQMAPEMREMQQRIAPELMSILQESE